MQNSLFTHVVRGSFLTGIARRCGWLQRRSRSLTPLVFVQAVVASVSRGYRSLREIATEVGLLQGGTYSKQALSERFNPASVALFKEVVARALRETLKSLPRFALDRLPGVARILIGDSSTISLHPTLFDAFPGGTNQHGVKSAQVRLQLTFDLLSGAWLESNLTPYRRNDKTAATDIVDTIVRAGDLIIRDLGYASIGAFRAISRAGAFFLSRLHASTKAMAPDGAVLGLLELARRHAPRPGDTFSRDILLGDKARFPCRLVMIRVPAEVANQRRRRLKKEARRRGSSHREDYRALQDWTVFVTNLAAEQADNGRLHQLYQTRWRVENIFKLMKSQTRLPKVAEHRSNRYHMETMLWAWLFLLVELSRQGLFRLCEGGPGGTPEVTGASVFKSVERMIPLVALALELEAAGSVGTLIGRLAEQQEYHDRYERRRKRISMPERVALALGLDLKLPAQPSRKALA